MIRISSENDIIKFPENDYFHDAVAYLAEYSWIYDFQLTNIFISDVIGKIPKEWIDVLLKITNDELNRIPFGFTCKEWPSSLQNFLKKSINLAKQCCSNENCNSAEALNLKIPDCIKQGMSPKKLVEVQCASALIGNICKQAGLSTILDIGSGLGYLDQVLHHNYGFAAFGVESIERKTISAKERLKKGPCDKNIHYFTETVSSDEKSIQTILKQIENIPKKECTCGHGNKLKEKQEAEKAKSNSGIIMVGLHCCGDLLPNILKHFISFPQIQCLVCIGCCYHLMSYNGQHFNNFPMSSALHNIINKIQITNPKWKPSTFGLRLAAQETRSRWMEQSEDTHNLHSKSVAYRGILQLLFRKDGIKWKKPRRHLARKNSMSSFEDYIQFALQDFAWTEKVREEKVQWLMTTFENYKHLMPVIEILTLLQVLMQPIWEAVIIMDRFVFMKENKIYTYIKNPFDEFVSPRNKSLICTKTE